MMSTELDAALLKMLDAHRLQSKLDDVLEHMTPDQRAGFLCEIVVQVIATFAFVDDGKQLGVVAACVGQAVSS